MQSRRWGEEQLDVGWAALESKRTRAVLSPLQRGARRLGCSVAAHLPRTHRTNVCPEGAREFRANDRNQGERGRKSDAPLGWGGMGAEGGYADMQPQCKETS